jgi:hypothetical protein
MITTETTAAGIGVSTALEPTQAGMQAAEQAVRALGESRCDLALVFGGMGYDHLRFLAGVRSVLGDVPLAGCSCQGVAAPPWAHENPRVAGLMALASDDLTFTHAMAEGLGRDSFEVGRRLSRELLASPPADPVVLLCFYDPLTGVNVDRLLAGLESERPIPIVGGAASQPWGRVVETRQFCDRRVTRDAAVCVLVSGRARAEIGVTHGAVSLGVGATITRADGNVIHEIDGRPAYDVWRDQVSAGEDFLIEDVALWALGIPLPEGMRDEYEGSVTRTLARVDREKRSIYLQAEVAEGTRVVFNRRTKDAVINGAMDMAERLRRKIGGRPAHFALSFECGGRSTPFLGAEPARREIADVQRVLGGGVPWLGFYAWGELAPMGGRNYFHNYTLPVCVIVPDTEPDSGGTHGR